MTGLEIRRAGYLDRVARTLVDAAMEDLADRYGSGDGTPVEPAESAPPHGDFPRYEAAGYERIPNFGYYRDEPGAVCYGRKL